MNEEDDEYNDFLKAQDEAKEALKQNGYRQQKIECCATCKHSFQPTIEDERTCTLIQIEHSGWCVGEVEDLAVCDKYEPQEEFE